ncbi:MAG TPA: hypothetical protein VFW65_26875 [Pseudonocardiaceae bacterium]|nr:hypothetical protein [Pseudonocardiaceae bacterium]
MSLDTGGYRTRWTVPCTDLIGHQRRVVISPASVGSTLLVALPSDTVRLTDEQALEMAADLVKAVREILPNNEEVEIKS